MKLRLLTLLFLGSLFNSLYSQTINFTYTGSVQTWIVPPCVTSINVVVTLKALTSGLCIKPDSISAKTPSKSK